MISYGKQSIDQGDIDAVVDVLKGDWLTQGPAVETFENDLQKYFVILPSTELWDVDKFRRESNSSVGKMCEFGFSYNSENNNDFLNVADLKDLIKNHM